MTDKERLEIIKGIQKRIKECQEKGQNVSNLHSDYVDWLLNRTEELELEVNDWREEVQKWQQFYKESEESHLETKELLKSIVNQNKRYREALEQIKKEETVTTALPKGQKAYTASGHIARKALEGEE